MKKLFIILAIISITAMGFTIKGQDDPPGRMRMQIMEKLNLNPDQLEKFNDFHYAHEKEVIDLKSEIEKNQLEIRKLMLDNTIDKSTLLNLTNKNNELRGKIQSSRISMWFDIYDILNADQRETWSQHFAHMGPGNGFIDRPDRPMHRGMMDRDCRRGMRDGKGTGDRLRIHRDK